MFDDDRIISVIPEPPISPTTSVRIQAGQNSARAFSSSEDLSAGGERLLRIPAERGPVLPLAVPKASPQKLLWHMLIWRRI